MKLRNGKRIFVEDTQAIGVVINEETNLVQVDGEEITVDPEFCHLPTQEEWNEAGLPEAEFETNNAEENKEEVLEAAGETVSSEAITDNQEHTEE